MNTTSRPEFPEGSTCHRRASPCAEVGRVGSRRRRLIACEYDANHFELVHTSAFTHDSDRSSNDRTSRSAAAFPGAYAFLRAL